MPPRSSESPKVFLVRAGAISGGDIIMTCLDNWCAPGVYVKRPYRFLRNSCVSPSYWYDIAWVDRPGLTGLCNVCIMGVSFSKGPLKLTPDGFLASVPLSIFRLNSKLDQNLKCSSLKYTQPITTKFFTPHESVTVVMCAKFRFDR